MEMTTLRVHFDGRVLVPEGPVDLPQDRSLEVEVRQISPDAPSTLYRRGHDVVNGIPVLRPGPNAKTITLEDVKRILDEC